MRGLAYSGLLAIGLCGAFAAAAQADTPENTALASLNALECRDHRGDMAALIDEDIYHDQADDYHMTMYAGARYLRGEASDGRHTASAEDIQIPVIVYDESFMDQLTPTQVRFIYLHECFHLSSGDAVTHYVDADLTGDTVTRMEHAADCHAVRYLRDEFDLQVDGLRELEALIRDVSPYRMEKQRIENLHSCYAAP